MTARRSPAVARAARALAVGVLPSTARSRYREEWLAEAHDLSRADQLRHAAGVLAGAPALSAALRAATEEDLMPLLASRGPLLRCRLLRWHDFVVRSTDDGDRFQVCRRCGTDRGPAGYGPMTTTPWPTWQ